MPPPFSLSPPLPVLIKPQVVMQPQVVYQQQPQVVYQQQQAQPNVVTIGGGASGSAMYCGPVSIIVGIIL